MNQSIHWNTSRFSIAPQEVTLFADRKDARKCAANARAYFAHNDLPRSVRIIPRTIRVATLGLAVFAVVVSTRS